MTERVVKWIRKVLVFVCIVIVIIAWLLIRSVNSYYSPDILRSFHNNEESFETLKDHLLNVAESKGIDDWYPFHITNDYVSSREDYQKLVQLTWGKKTYLLDNGRVFFDKKMIVFRYYKKGDDAQIPLFLIYTPNKNDIPWYINKCSITDWEVKIIEISEDWYYVPDTFSSVWKRRLGF